jgi:hypothetical protein
MGWSVAMGQWSLNCGCTNDDQSVDHFIFDCPILDKEREKLIAYTSREEY